MEGRILQELITDSINQTEVMTMDVITGALVRMAIGVVFLVIFTLVFR